MREERGTWLLGFGAAEQSRGAASACGSSQQLGPCAAAATSAPVPALSDSPSGEGGCTTLDPEGHMWQQEEVARAWGSQGWGI